MKVGDWRGSRKPVARAFPAAAKRTVPLRIAVEAVAHAAMHLHANEDLEREVCGVLVGDVCEDDAGLFVHVQAVVRGSSAKSGSTHVTYTPETSTHPTGRWRPGTRSPRWSAGTTRTRDSA